MASHSEGCDVFVSDDDVRAAAAPRGRTHVWLNVRYTRVRHSLSVCYTRVRPSLNVLYAANTCLTFECQKNRACAVPYREAVGRTLYVKLRVIGGGGADTNRPHLLMA